MLRMMSQGVFRGPQRIEVLPAYAVVVEHIRRAIHLGEYKPGDKLMPERRHAEHLGVSRVTLREAIRVLEGEGYVQTRRGSAGGVIVLSTRESPEQLREQLRGRLDELLDIQDFRLVNERLAAERAAERADEEDFAALEEALAAMEASEGLGDFRQADSAFHLRIAAAARSPLLMAAIEEARAAMFNTADAFDGLVTVAASLKAHQRIFAAMQDRDAARAGRAMARHVESTSRDLVAFAAPE
jgi:DNA-binding FadR family transcriptional regulator